MTENTDIEKLNGRENKNVKATGSALKKMI